MFAVSGWNLASGPQTQVDESTKKKKTNKVSKRASSANALPISNKRNPEAIAAAAAAEEASKPKLKPEPVVNKHNVLKLYEQVIEGKPDLKKKRDRKNGKKSENGENGEKDVQDGEGKGKKRSKPHGEESGDNADADCAAPPQKKKKTLKEKRREKKAAAAAVAAGTALTESKPNAEISSKPTPAAPTPASAISSLPALTPLQQKMREKLTSARFRHINEILYTTPSNSSLELFTAQPEMYQEYHTGFRRQVEVWPENPVDIFIKQLQTRGKLKFERGHNRKVHTAGSELLPLPRDREEGWCTVADLGCGDAKIATTIKNQKPRGKSRIKVLSFDLQASTPNVQVADIANLPLEPDSVDIAIFCLALMGTNFLGFITEAHRILRPRGELWIAEIKSRFNSPSGGREKEVVIDDDAEGGKKGDDEAFKPFIAALSKRGFSLRGKVDTGNKMFVRMEFIKLPENNRPCREGDTEAAAGGEEKQLWKPKMQKKKLKFIDNDEDRENKILKPCVYKLR
ncbi:25S rRNA (adenine645-N1)-methyltransferase [Rhizina undulata]